MSHPHQYHQPNAPDGDDLDSDLELDLAELNDPLEDSKSKSEQYGRLSGEGRTGGSGRASDIPLRNLRGKRTRRIRHPSEDYLDHFDNRDVRDSGENAEDDQPLLPTHRTPRRPKQNRKDSNFKRLGSSLGLDRLRSGSRGRPDAEAQDEEDVEEHDPTSSRTVLVGQRQPTRFPQNAVSNAKYEPWTFLPVTLYNEFKFFLNMYFLLVALSQIIPQLRIGYLSTYVVPLAFVLAVTLGKEAWDDIARRRRDAEANSEAYTVLRFGGDESSSKRKSARVNGHTGNGHIKTAQSGVIEMIKTSRDLKVGDVIKLAKNQRVPADLIILQSISSESTEAINKVEAIQAEDGDGELLAGVLDDGDEQAHGQASAASGASELTGEAFIRTDQLDGETDWKLRLSAPLAQGLALDDLQNLKITAGKPDKKVNDFAGTIELIDDGQGQSKTAPLTIDNTAWANTVLASTSIVYAAVIYTGSQTRQALSTSASRSKTGLLELELNTLTKILCGLTLSLSCVLVLIGGLEHENKTWYISVMRYLILFSTVVPISLRVNLDMGKTVYAWFIEHDQGIPGTVVRTSTIPEDLGRIEYLLSDKTGTLTQNEMELKKIHVGTVSYANEAMEEVTSYIRHAFAPTSGKEESQHSLVTPSTPFTAPTTSATRTRREIGARVRDLVLALALCHNVTPTIEEENGEPITTYQASSPDEIAIVKWTESVGLRLLHRDRTSMMLESTSSNRIVVKVQILNIFPFTSEGKRMGIVVRFDTTSGNSDDSSEIWFFQKGADTVMTTIVAANDWLDEETANMAREGLRTLVVGRKRISPAQYTDFTDKYNQASLVLQSRDAAMLNVVKQYLEQDLELLGVTGVEDKLQRDVKPSLELLRNAGVKIWMLTGDKVETARCVAVSSRLVARGQFIQTVAKLKRKDAAQETLDLLRSKPDACLLIDGESLSLMLEQFREQFISIAVRLPTVVACRCSPTQKADVAKLIRAYTKKRVCCIGDGGNDVSMIQAADVGVGIVGKEGKQASLAADFSIEQFCYLTKLLVWHGRNSYKRSAKLAQFVIHRGLIISVCQTMFSIASRFEPHALYRVSPHIPPLTLHIKYPHERD